MAYNATSAHSTTPNDPLYNPAQMWGLYKIRAADAWDITTGTAGVAVAVSDSGRWTPPR